MHTPSIVTHTRDGMPPKATCLLPFSCTNLVTTVHITTCLCATEIMTHKCKTDCRENIVLFVHLCDVDTIRLPSD
jgi:hypothetical protein